MKKIILLLLLAACSHTSKNAPLSPTAKETPDWVYSPYEFCVEDRELCATGEGKTMSEADAQAKNNLASIFEVRIKSNLTVNTSATQSMPWIAQVNEEVRQSVQQSVDEVLEQVQVKKHFRKDGLSYALASLNRAAAQELIGPRLEKIDKEIEVLWENRQRTSLRKLVKLNLEREKINERFAIVSGQGRTPKVSFEQILRWKESRPKSAPVYLKVGQAPEWLVEKMKELLTESGFKLVKKDSNRVVSMNVNAIKEYLNVEGFEKFTFTLNLQSFENGEKKKVLSTSETVTGRSQADALLKVKKIFTEYIEEHLSDLHLD